MWVFEQEKRVRLDAGFDRKFGLFLDCEGGFVVDEPQPLDQKLSFVIKSCNQIAVFRRHSISRVGLWYNRPSTRKTKLTAEEEKHTLKPIAITLLAALLT